MVNEALAASGTPGMITGDTAGNTKSLPDDVKCSCPHRKCKYHSKCDLCVAHHEAHKKYKPYCQRDRYLKKVKNKPGNE